MTRPSVYRCYADDILLYIGFSANVAQRMRGHRSRSSWFGDMTHFVVEEYADHGVALQCETEAIRREKPPHNTIHTTRNSAAVAEEARVDRLVADWTPADWSRAEDHILAVTDTLFTGAEPPPTPEFLRYQEESEPTPSRTYRVDVSRAAA